MYWLRPEPGPEPIREILVIEFRSTTTIRLLLESLIYRTSFWVIDIPKGVFNWVSEDPAVPFAHPSIVTPLWFQDACGERVISARIKRQINILQNGFYLFQRKHNQFYVCWSLMKDLLSHLFKNYSFCLFPNFLNNIFSFHPNI